MKSLFVVFLLAAGCGAAEGLTREYIFVRDHYSWPDAQTYCRRHYKDLATVTSNNENKRLLQSGLSNYDSWIGLCMSSTDISKWSDGGIDSFRNWNEGSPYVSNSETCAYVYYNSFWLNAFVGNGKTFYCYQFLILVNQKKTWDDALQYCISHYTGLASVTTEASLRQLKVETMGTDTESVWTGLRFMNGQWRWKNEEKLGDLVSMLSSCPDESSCCGALNTAKNTLNNKNCNEQLNFVCYKK